MTKDELAEQIDRGRKLPHERLCFAGPDIGNLSLVYQQCIGLIGHAVSITKVGESYGFYTEHFEPEKLDVLRRFNARFGQPCRVLREVVQGEPYQTMVARYLAFVKGESQ